MVVQRSEAAELAEIEQAIARYGLGIRFYDYFNRPQRPSQIKRERQEALEKQDGVASIQEEF